MNINKARIRKIKNRVKSNSIVAATNYIDIDGLNALYDHGIDIFGENKVKDFLRKYEQFSRPVTWHFIGTLHTNKVKYIIDKIDLIHSVDSLDLIKEIQTQALKKDRVMNILLQVNISNVATKHGFNKENIYLALNHLKYCPNIRCFGLMMMAPYVEKQQTRIYFKETNQLLSILQKQFPMLPLHHLSMGMSNDYEIALEEGATILRLGSILFD